LQSVWISNSVIANYKWLINAITNPNPSMFAPNTWQ
jgi:hypothetical protein